mmetsp:Transcript_9880/g.17374  ORF Transcript_9880/g.17374 Transcript_9880/m.17374 type:complete len:181 (+) Transcript_9880:146-688(+)
MLSRVALRCAARHTAVRRMGSDASAAVSASATGLGGAPLASEAIVKVTLVDFEGKRHEMTGLVGQTLTEASEMNDLGDILKEDGKGGGLIGVQEVHNERWTEDLYGTGETSFESHVIISEDYVNKLPPMFYDEKEMLDLAEAREPGVITPNSRLGTAIKLTKDLDGMVVHVPDAYPTDLP